MNTDFSYFGIGPYGAALRESPEVGVSDIITCCELKAYAA